MSGHATTTIPPPAVKFVLLQVPAPHVLLVAINFEKQMNSLPVDAVWEMHRVWKWFDDEPELRVGIVTGAAACNGHAHGGGFEIVLSSDIVIASENADFRLPDVLRGTAAMAGAFPRPIDDLIKEAVDVAKLIASMSPDSVIVTRAGIRQAWETSSIEHATFLTGETYAAKLMSGENAREGMLAFKEKRPPKWVPSKL
ncbi:enoyl-CoA hydratase [Histoplasma capsulatum H143]|uniref:Enoyl-CoA hydratase n=1 Tax=Ajellomyces capsulatus (strain H143) TaxID=544712 RepID=C6H2T8_AJECH|nr:enoyl-CoA hydratase [Histoplasma capsulatum H143]